MTTLAPLPSPAAAPAWPALRVDGVPLAWPPIGTLVEDPSALPGPRPPLMKRMCCHWLPVPDGAPAGTRPEQCGMVLGWVVCAAELDGQITHSACSTRWLEELREDQAAEYTTLGAGEAAARYLCAPGGAVDRRTGAPLAEAGAPECVAGDTSAPDGGRILSVAPETLTFRSNGLKEGDVFMADGRRYEVRGVARIFSESSDEWCRAVRLPAATGGERGGA